MPYTIHRASAALPAAGAYDTASNPWELGAHTPEISVPLTYTAGGAGGFPGLRIQWTIAGVTASIDTLNDNAITTSGAVATVEEYEFEVDCNSLLNGSAKSTIRVFRVPPGATHVRIDVRERGNTGAPGTLEVRLARSV